MLRSVTHSLLAFSQRRAGAVLAITAIITAVLTFFALQVDMDTDFDNMFPEDEEMTVLIEKYGGRSIAADYLMLAFEREDIFDVEALTALSLAIDKIDAMDSLHASVTPFSLFTFLKGSQRLELVPISPQNSAPKNAEQLEVYRTRIEDDPLAENIVVSSDLTSLFAIFPVDQVVEYEAIMDEVNVYLEPVREYFTIYEAGTVALQIGSRKYLRRDFQTLIALACLFILVLYYTGFRAKRAIFLPISVVGIGAIWCIGFMGILGYSISLVSIVIPPLVLTLGSSYSIHILNQYYREAQVGAKSSEWITGAVTHVARTIQLASLTTIVGFVSLIAARTPQTREFGIASGIGIAACGVLSLFYLPAALSLLKPPTTNQKKRVTEGPLTRLMARLGTIVIRWRFLVLAVFIATCGAFAFSVSRVTSQLDYMEYFPASSQVSKSMQFIIDKVGGLQQLQLTLSAPSGDEKNYFLQTEVLEHVSQLEAEIQKRPNVIHTRSFVSYLEYLNSLYTGKPSVPESKGLILLLSRYFKAITSESNGNTFLSALANPDFTYLTVTFKVYDTVNNRYLFEDSVRKELADIQSLARGIMGPEVNIDIWGNSLRLITLADILRKDLRISMLIAFLIILAITTIAFKSFKYGLAALIPLGTGIMLNFTFMYVFRIPMDVTTMMVSSVAIGVGVDNAIHFLLQFVKQLKDTPDSIVSTLSRTLQITGRPILLTTFSVVGGLLVLCFASFKPIIYFGLLVAIALLNTAIGTLVVLPVVLAFSWSIKRKRAIA